MIRPVLFFVLVALATGVVTAQESRHHELFPPYKGFVIEEFEVRDPGTYRFYDQDGNPVVVSGRHTYLYYEFNGEADPKAIINNFFRPMSEAGAEIREYDGNKLCLHLKHGKLDVWANIVAGNFYYTINIVEQCHIEQEVTAEKIKADLEEKGECVLYLRFAFRSDEIDSLSLQAVETVAEVLFELPTLIIDIEGHTEKGRSISENRQLSYNRAMAVAMRLVQAGVDRERLSVSGMGEESPVADNETLEGQALNRRIVIRKK